MKINLQKNKAFVLLFSIMLSSILLAITIGVTNIALKEINFSASARDTNDAFFAADTGIECALLYDSSTASQNAFTGTAGPDISCANSNITISRPSLDPVWNFVVPYLSVAGKACAIVKVDKTLGTVIVSKGYNTGDGSCVSTNLNRVEREIQASY